MIIIFEGMDRTGKDTQIKLLQKYLLDKPQVIYHYQKIDGIDNNICKKYSKLLYKDMFKIINTNKNKRHIIFNRAHLGELVYGKIYRKYNANYLHKLEAKIKDINNIYLIVLTSDNNKLEDGNSLSNGEIKLINKEKELFINTFNNSNIKNKILIDINDKSIEDINKEILYFLKLKENI